MIVRVVERICLYADEHVPPAVTAGIRRRGGDIVTIQEVGLRGATDDAHLAYAVTTGRTILTQDTDFLRFHASGRPHPGIIYAAMHLPIGEIIRGVMLIQELLTPEDMANHIEFL